MLDEAESTLTIRLHTHGHFYIQKYFCHQEKEKKMSRTCQSNPKCVKLLVNQKPTKEHGAQSRVKEKKALNPCKQGNYSPAKEIF